MSTRYVNRCSIRDTDQRLLGMYADGRYLDRRGKHDSEPVRQSIALLGRAGLIEVVDEQIIVTKEGLRFLGREALGARAGDAGREAAAGDHGGDAGASAGAGGDRRG